MPLKENDAAAFTLFSFTSCAQQKKRLLPPCALQPDSEVDGSWCSENLQLGLLLTECALALLPCAHRRLPRQFETLAEVLCLVGVNKFGFHFPNDHFTAWPLTGALDQMTHSHSPSL